MPDYYYELMADGRIVSLMDLDCQYAQTVEGIAQLLRDKHLLAFKLVKASLGVGFYRAEYKDGVYWLNDESMDLNAFVAKLKTLKGYLVTEYLLPHHSSGHYHPRPVFYLAVSVYSHHPEQRSYHLLSLCVRFPARYPL